MGAIALALLTAATTTTAASLPPPNDAHTPKLLKIVPAWDHDLPVGTGTYGPAKNSPSPATTKARPASVPWICSVYASDPEQAHDEIIGNGWQSCSGTGYEDTQIRVTVQKYWHLGIWNNVKQVDSGWSSSYWLDRYVYADCVSGKHEYRVITDGWAV